MNTYIADIEGDSLREVVLYIDHLAEIASIKSIIEAHVRCNRDKNDQIAKKDEEIAALQAYKSDMEFTLNNTPFKHWKERAERAEARIKELEGIIAQIKNMDRSDLDSGYRMYENLARKNEHIEQLQARITHCDNCGGSWYDDGLTGRCLICRIKELEAGRREG